MSDERTIKPNAPADFTPQLGDYKTLQPFRYWCQKVLPLVYDDSLSYYELLCKVVDYLNKAMEDVETLHGDVTSLHTAYTELQNYVNIYFSTLDVQVEINNKLDKMAESGVLGNILSKIIPIGQPIFINSTNEMTNKNAIYVLTTNGMIYMYKNTQFEATGLTYGSPNNVLINQITTTYTKFRDIDTIGYVRITSEIYNAMSDKKGLPTGVFSGVLLNLNHVFQNEGIRYQELLLYSSRTGYLTYRRFFGTTSPADTVWTEYNGTKFTMFNSDTTVKTKFRDIDTIGYVRITSEIYNAMSDKKGLPTGVFSGVLLNLNHVFQNEGIRYQELLLYSSRTGYLTYRRFFGITSPDDAVWTEYNETKFTMLNTDTTVKTKFRDIDTLGYVRITSEIYNAMSDKKGLPTGVFSGVLLNLNHVFQNEGIRYQELLLYSSRTGYLTYRRFFGITSPDDAVWTEYGITGHQKNINYIALGDSRTKGKEKNYPEIIQDNLGYTVTNLGVSGSTIMPKEGHDSMVNIVKSYNFNSADVVSIMYGRNDYKLLNPLGTYLDTTNTTVMGCLYTSIVKILNDNNKCNIVVFSPFNDFSYGSAPNYAKDFKNSAGYTLENLCNEIKKFCNYYQLKYVDLINTFPTTINLKNIPDGVHLTDDSGLASIVASEIY